MKINTIKNKNNRNKITYLQNLNDLLKVVHSSKE